MKAHRWRMRSKTAGLITTLFATFICCVALAEPTQPAFKLKIIEGQPVVDCIFLNGHGPYRFVLDTGSQTNQVEARLAKKLGLVVTLQAVLDTPSGPSRVQGGKVSKVSLGAVEATDQEFLFTGFDEFHARSQDIQGVLGQAFLAHFDYTLDFQHHRLTFGKPPAAGNRVPVRVVYGCMEVPTNLGELMLDSGAGTLFLFRSSLGETTETTTQISAASGLSVAVSVGPAPVLLIGGKQYYPVSAAFRAVAHAPAAGLLPASLFHAIFISNSNGYVVFNPETR